MTILDDKLLPGVKKILLKVGEAATLTEGPSPGDYDATTGATVDTPATHSVLITPPGPNTEFYPIASGGGQPGDIGRKRDIVTILSKLLLTETVPAVPDPKIGWKLTITATSQVLQILAVENIKGAWQLTVE